MIYYKSEIKNPENYPKIDAILEQLEVDIGEDLEKEKAQLLQQIKDLGEEDLYEELKG